MSHHGENPFSEFEDQQKILQDLIKQEGGFDTDLMKQFPAGKIHENDEGIIAFRITHKEDKIVIDFGKPVYWFGLELKEAKGLVELLTKHIKDIELGRGKID